MRLVERAHLLIKSRAKNLISAIWTSVGIPVVFMLSAALLWEGVVRLLKVPAYLLPAPSTIAAVMLHDPSTLMLHTGVTAFEALMGFLLATLIAFSTAVLFAHSRLIKRGLYPFAIALKTTPIVAFAPLLVLWLGTGLASKIMASVLICFFPILVNATKGLTAVGEDALYLLSSLGASKWQVFRFVRMHNSLPYLFSALKVSSSLSVVGAIVGEFVGSNVGLGFWILISSYHLETADMFAAIIAAAVIGIIFFYLISLVERRWMLWAPDVQE